MILLLPGVQHLVVSKLQATAYVGSVLYVQPVQLVWVASCDASVFSLPLTLSRPISDVVLRNPRIKLTPEMDHSAKGESCLSESFRLYITSLFRRIVYKPTWFLQMTPVHVSR